MTLQPSPCHNHQPQQRTILLVEDEPFVRDATGSILERAGFAALPAQDASEAITIYEQCRRRIDLVMTDIVLPGRTGLQLGQDLRQRSPELLVLLTSGYGNAEYHTEAPELRTYFLAKPYSRRSLVEKIEEILDAPPLAHVATQAG
jgi:DNA-binding NtrC family response regulator